MKININMTIEIEDEVLSRQNESKEKEDNVLNTSKYARFFDENSKAWCKEPHLNYMFLKHVQNHANDLLKVRGYVLLNDVYDMLGIPLTEDGAVVGWVYKTDNPIGDNFIDFGIFKDFNLAEVDTYANVVLLDFNVDGKISDCIK